MTETRSALRFLSLRAKLVGLLLFVEASALAFLVWQGHEMDIARSEREISGEGQQIEVTLYAERGNAIVEISDNGSGVPEEVRDRIFEPSFTTKTSGMGLGLAMVKRMVEQASGTVHFTTRLDEGTTFVITLPLTTSA